jgi:hypothetical protein
LLSVVEKRSKLDLRSDCQQDIETARHLPSVQMSVLL